MHDYQNPDRGWCGDPRRGAAMGRGSDLDRDSDATLTIRRVPIDDGGYDPGGTYWGIGEPLFCVSDGDGVGYLRAGSFNLAKESFPRAVWARFEIMKGDLEDALQGYAEGALSTTMTSACGMDEDEDEDDYVYLDERYTITDIDHDTYERMRENCSEFIKNNKKLLESVASEQDIDWYQLGRDFWLEHNGSGGFDYEWPRRWTKDLSEACKPWGSVYLYVSDDETIKID